jgi:hypothetical protein
VTVVPYAEFVARRERRLRIMAELSSEARAQTIEGEVRHGQGEEGATPAEGESPDGSGANDGCGTEQNEQRHLRVFRQSLLLMKSAGLCDER